VGIAIYVPNVGAEEDKASIHRKVFEEGRKLINFLTLLTMVRFPHA